jgi:hypothetical protein
VDAASTERVDTPRGAPQLLEHCAALERLTAVHPGSAWGRLEIELGRELTRFLCTALAGGGVPRGSSGA